MRVRIPPQTINGNNMNELDKNKLRAEALIDQSLENLSCSLDDVMRIVEGGPNIEEDIELIRICMCYVGGILLMKKIKREMMDDILGEDE